MQTFAHEMLREIYEQPEALRRTVALYLADKKLKPEVTSKLARWTTPEGEVLIAASGSSRHAGVAGEILLEDLCGLAVDVEYASEYSTRRSKDHRHPSVLVLSQSGETSDTLAVLREARRRGEKTLAITNVTDSTMAQEADVYEARRLGRSDGPEIAANIERLLALPASIEEQLDGWRQQTAELAAKYKSASTFLFLGRGIHYAIAREGALKLKEASYVPAEGYPAGELKHGPNALVSDQLPLVVMATVDRALEGSVLRYETTLQLLRDMKAQGARVIAIANTGDKKVAHLVSDCIEVHPATEYLLPIAEVVPLQLFAYFTAMEHGVDVDRPRNLSKAVVEG